MTETIENPVVIQDPIAVENSIANKSFVRKFFAFDEFITARVLKIVYILGSVLIVLYTIVQLATGLYMGFNALSRKLSFFPIFENFLSPIFWILVGLLFFIATGLLALLALRLYCEFMMVIFKIHENLQAVRNRNVQV